MTIADYFGAGMISLGDVIALRLRRVSEHRALVRNDEGAAELGQGERGVLRLGRLAERLKSTRRT